MEHLFPLTFRRFPLGGGNDSIKKMSLDSSAFGVRMTVQRGGRDGAMFGAVFLPASSHVSFTQSLIGLYGSSAYDQG